MYVGLHLEHPNLFGLLIVMDAPRSKKPTSIELLAYCLHLKADFLQIFMLENFPAIENECWLHH